ncbi:hypothetical protein MKW92_048447 [Papaver armeniacum]|nr:hypothetical protein MKW92_048447 [Papaver armeniacum]
MHKGIAEAKVDKIIEAASKLVPLGFTGVSQLMQKGKKVIQKIMKHLTRGAKGKAMYIDTKGTSRPQRLADYGYGQVCTKWCLCFGECGGCWSLPIPLSISQNFFLNQLR